jgi:hypothetical protein
MSIAFYRHGAGDLAAAVALESGVDSVKAVGYQSRVPTQLVHYDDVVYLLGVVPGARDLETLAHKTPKLIFIDHRDNNIKQFNQRCRDEEVKKLPCEIVKCVDTTTPMTVQLWNHLRPSEQAPEAVHLFGQYMTGSFAENVLNFHYGCEVYNTSDIFMWRRILQEGMELKRILELGAYYKQYWDALEAYYAAFMVYPTEFAGYPALALNAKDATSNVFSSFDGSGAFINLQYVWKPWTHEYIVTVGSTDPSISAASECEPFGGGGSSQVAGFKCVALPFEENEADSEVPGFDSNTVMENFHTAEHMIQNDTGFTLLHDKLSRRIGNSQQLIRGKGVSAVVNNTITTFWRVEPKCAEADFKISWAWHGRHPMKKDGGYVLRVQKLSPQANWDMFVQFIHVDKKGINIETDEALVNGHQTFVTDKLPFKLIAID